jgi:hypothetical protein
MANAFLPRTLPFLRGLATAVFGMTLAGCGSPTDKLLPVVGTVTLAGKPLTKGTVVFHPDKERGNATPHEPRGQIDGQGRYEMVTAGQPGVPPGHFKVCVLAVKQASNPNDPYSKTEFLVDRRYVDASKTPLEVEVAADPPAGRYDFNVKP